METHVDFEVAHLCPHTHGLESAIPKIISFSVDQVWVAARVSVSLEVQLFLSSLSLSLSLSFLLLFASGNHILVSLVPVHMHTVTVPASWISSVQYCTSRANQQLQQLTEPHSTQAGM